MKIIEISNNKEALVDDEDFEELSKYKWTAQRWKYGWYATRRKLKKEGRNKGENTRIYMHRAIMKVDKDTLIDHIDRNGLNNQKTNLRTASRKDNAGNSITHIKKSCKFKGVCKRTKYKSFDAQIRINNKAKHLGCFKTPEEAALAYDKAAIEYYGEFAKLNFMT